MNNVKVYTTKNYLKVILVKMGDMKQLDRQKLFTECARQCARGFCYELFLCFSRFFLLFFFFSFLCASVAINCIVFTIIYYY